MHKILVLYPHPQDEKKFRPHYEDIHLRLVQKLPGLLASRHSFVIQGEPGARAPFFCVFEAEFTNEAAMVTAMQSVAGQAVVADVPNFATTPPTVVNYAVANG
jgi:uncharacterized protein (TIGR02118 family)